MDDTSPAITLKTTTEKFKVLNDSNHVSNESENDASEATDPLTDGDWYDSDDEYAEYCDKTEHN